MKATLLIILLSNGGHWLADSDYTASVSWLADAPMPPSDLIWDLEIAGVHLGGDRVSLGPRASRAEIRMKCPRVRARTTLNWKYCLVDRKDGKQLETGQLEIHAYPADLTSGWAQRVAGRKLQVCDPSGKLTKLLSHANLSCESVEDITKFRGPCPDAILIGANAIEKEPGAQVPLMALAKAGASVMIFRQAQPTTLFGFELTRRAAPPRFDWLKEHLLLSGLPIDAATLWGDHPNNDLIALRIPQDAAVLPIGWWPTESHSAGAGPVDALLAVQATGKGRIVICQIPLGEWDSDPLSQILLGNALDYLLTIPEPTPPHSQTGEVPRVQMKIQIPTITIPPGDKP